MKPNQERIADLWCRLMHTALVWPSHGQYECRPCGRRHRVCWEQRPPAEPCVMAMSFETRAQNAFGNSTFGNNNVVDPMFGNSGQGHSMDSKDILCQFSEEREHARCLRDPSWYGQASQDQAGICARGSPASRSSARCGTEGQETGG
jgi:hypothetical protein